MLHERSSLGPRKVSPPTPVFMSSERKASYLADLRTNRPSRPAGSRPLPSRPSLSTGDENVPPRAGSALSLRDEPSQPLHDEDLKRHTLSKRASMPAAGTVPHLNGFKGRPLVPSPGTDAPSAGRKVSPPFAAHQENAYRESTARTKEKQEAHALREALVTIDKRDEEKRLHEAAKSEASDLVWRHCNPDAAAEEKTAPYRNPDLSGKKYGDLTHSKPITTTAKVGSVPNSRSSSSESTESQKGRRRVLPWLRRRPKQDSENQRQQERELRQEPTPDEAPVRKASGGRKPSSGSTQALFRNPEDQIYEEPIQDEVQVQEPDRRTPVLGEHTSQAPDPHVRRLYDRSFHGTRPLPLKSQSLPSTVTQRQVRDQVPSIREDDDDDLDAIISGYRSESPETPMKDGLEIRSEEIRAATSMKKKDRSPNLPTPTAVSNRPGRPIVSFDPKWRPSSGSPAVNSDLSSSKSKPNNVSIPYPVPDIPAVPTITIMDAPSQEPRLSNGAVSRRSENASPAVVNATAESNSPAAHSSTPSRPLPTICLPDQDTDIPVPPINIETEPTPRPLPPTINFPEQNTDVSVPSIAIQDDAAARPLPPPTATDPRTNARPLPHHTQSAPSKLPLSRPPGPGLANRVPWLHRTPTSSSTTSVTCNACSLPISGRVVTASGSSTTAKKGRFHPECFTCHHCSTPLECVSFYPEPDGARLERFQDALPHLPPDGEQIHSLASGVEDLHFFCHLDYHEQFSPRCHSCKTPVEGSVIVALGRHYHTDHFFCAECGDPFTPESPFVEHNNYPYCVSCHTKRTSARCRACKRQILDEMTVEALGAKWHDACFVCFDCGGDFGDEGRFFVREIEVELTDKEKRKCIGPKFEERAACQGCEETRLKNADIYL